MAEGPEAGAPRSELGDRPVFRSGPEGVVPRPGEHGLPFSGRADLNLHQAFEESLPARLAGGLPRKGALDADPGQDRIGHIERKMEPLDPFEERGGPRDGRNHLRAQAPEIAEHLRRLQAEDLQPDGVAPPGAQAEDIEQAGRGGQGVETGEDSSALAGGEGTALESREQRTGDPAGIGALGELYADHRGRHFCRQHPVEIELQPDGADGRKRPFGLGPMEKKGPDEGGGEAARHGAGLGRRAET